MRCSQKQLSIILLVQTLPLEPLLENFSALGKCHLVQMVYSFFTMPVSVMTISDPGDSDLLNFAEEHAS